MKLLVVILLSLTSWHSFAQKGFVTRKDGQLFVNDKQYKFIGSNYWYGSLLALQQDEKRGIQRLRTELDFLKNYGITRKVKSLTASYLYKHLKVAYHLKKPLVVEEFGFPRDNMQFDPASSTALRDSYYDYLFNAMTYFKNENAYTKMLAGMNFWSFNGTAKPIEGQLFWKPGDDYMGDPPMEEQSLYGVFDSDSSTLRIIQKHTDLLRKK
jgi:endo-1,4-beta-mannosidase